MNDTPHQDPSPDHAIPPVTASVAAPSTSQPSQIVVRSPHGLGRRLWMWIGWAGFLFCLVALISQWSARKDYFDVTEGVRERYHSGAKSAADKVAIIAVRGVIMDGNGFAKQQIERVRQDDRVKAVVVRVESPGGTVTGSDYIYHHLKQLREERQIPLVVSMGSIATSGGYYVSMAVGDQERSIYAEPTTTTGSIGVIMPHYDISGLLQQLNVEDDSITSHPRKHMLSMTRTMSESERELVQAYIDDSFQRFKSIVKSGRPQLRQANEGDQLMAPGTDRDLATGEIFSASKALEYGLVDEIGFIEEALARATELAGLEADCVRYVEYRRPPSLLGILGVPQAKQPASPLSAIFEVSTPRAYFLSTTLPLMAASHGESSPH
jgi:protease-4